jgi:hypothetical protein
MAQISPARLREMERLAAHDPALRFPIIITLKEGAPPESLEDSGFRPQYRALNIISGSASVDAIRRLSALNQVEMVEEDGEVRALDSSAS